MLVVTNRFRRYVVTRRLAAALLLVVALAAPAGAASTTDYPKGRPMAERCALARQRVRVPFPERWLRCTAERAPSGGGYFWAPGTSSQAIGQCVCDPGKVWWLVVYAGTDDNPEPTGEVAATIAHEVGHAYSFLAWDAPDERWVGHNELFADHWERCLTTTNAPC